MILAFLKTQWRLEHCLPLPHANIWRIPFARTKNICRVTIDNNALTVSTAHGTADIEADIDWLAGKPDDGLPDFDMVNIHVSTPAFIADRLIQRFTTSNPFRD